MPTEVSFEVAAKAREALREELPVVSDFMGGRSEQPFSVVLGAPAGIGFRGPSTGISLHIRADETKAFWQHQSTLPYPGFEKLRGLLSVAVQSENLSVAHPVQMHYVNLVPPEDGDILDLIRGEALPKMASGAELMHKVESSWRIGEGLDYRMGVQRTELGFVLICAAGYTSAANPLDALDIVHGALQAQFLDVVTERALEAWQYAVS